MVHALGVFHALHEAYPAAEIGWAIQPEFQELVEPLPGLTRVVPFERGSGWRAWPRLKRHLRDFAPELVVDAQGNLKSAAVVWASRAPRRAGMARQDWREPLGARVLNERAPAMPPGTHHALDRMEALARFVAPKATKDFRIDPALSNAERALGRNALAERIGPRNSEPILLHLSSPEDVRSWPAAHWEALIRRLSAEGQDTLVLGGPSERALGRELFSQLGSLPHIHFWFDQKGLRMLAAVFAAAAERGGRMVVCDTGPMHLAIGCGLEVVALAGPQDPERTGPWRRAPGSHRVVRALPQPDCAPCLARTCKLDEGPICMSGLSSDRVLEGLLRQTT